VHGLSAVDDPADSDWLDDNWHGRQLAGSVIYELHIGTYSPEGTFDAAIARLDHLVELGVDFVELLPVNGFNGEHNWGYDGVAWFAVHERYGGPAGYRRFVDACHTRGLAVIQDVVHNHLGPSGNYLPRFGPYLHRHSSNTWGDSVNLGNLEVRRFVLDNIAMWFEDFHVDGLRLDAVHALVDESPTHILQAMAEETDARSPTSAGARAHRRVRHERPAPHHAARGRRLRPHRAVERRPPPRHPRAVTGEADGYYADFATADALPKTSTRGFITDCP